MLETSNRQTSRHGLSRNIPNSIKRTIRQNCGFGCIICGCATYEYEHVDPSFEDATVHDPDKMTLLCGSCHSYVTRGIWSKDRVKAAMRNPKCLEKGFSLNIWASSG
jgi:hypothetical protein